MVLGTAQAAGASRGAGKSDVVCHHCGRKGHMKRDCWQLHGKPASLGAKGTPPRNDGQ